MLYRDLIRSFANERGIELQILAERIGMKPNTLYQRLKESWNPRVGDMLPILHELGYEMVFVKKDDLERNEKIEVGRVFVPEFPERPTRTTEEPKKSDPPSRFTR